MALKRPDACYPRLKDMPYITTATGAVSTTGINSEKSVRTVRTELVWRWNWGR